MAWIMSIPFLAIHFDLYITIFDCSVILISHLFHLSQEVVAFLAIAGCLHSLDWTTGLDYWTGILDWTTGLNFFLFWTSFYVYFS